MIFRLTASPIVDTGKQFIEQKKTATVYAVGHGSNGWLSWWSSRKAASELRRKLKWAGMITVQEDVLFHNNKKTWWEIVSVSNDD